ncbi:MAG: CpaF family protein [Proteobacteria bacterium]|nr:CpaF family protein [Pseudomonadota bacterium]
MFGKKQSGQVVSFGKQASFGQKTVAQGQQQHVPRGKALFARKEGEAYDPRLRHKPEMFFADAKLQNDDFRKAKKKLTEMLLEGADFASLQYLSEDVKRERIREACESIISKDITLPLTAAQIALLKDQAIDDLLGFGPIEVLMADEGVSDIMINGHNQVFIEKAGKILLTDIQFGSERHLLSVVQKIVSIVGRRIDESSPMVDARMPDGSRFNAIIPPLAIDGCLVSIRKFKKQKMNLHAYVGLGSMSDAMYRFLSICSAIRLNIIISGGTGSGKTTLLNALSGGIDVGERVVTIEDAAELQLQQPHVLRMETRPANMEGAGEVTQRHLVKNALRMRPDRIILGEIRGDEVVDMLSAMNTGHDGSMGTIHANTPRDAISRIENLVGMSAVNIGGASLRQQIASAVHVVVQIARQRDGKRRITQIDEVVGMEGGEIVLRTLFQFKPGPVDENGIITGEYVCTGIKPHFLTQAAYFGREAEMLASLET